MPMPLLTLIYAVVLILVGAAGYALSDSKSLTALIPTFVGIVFLVLGAMALKADIRKHAMHAAAGLAVLLVLASGGRMISSGFEEIGLAFFTQLATVVATIAYIVFSVKSFIDARKRRKAGEAAGAK